MHTQKMLASALAHAFRGVYVVREKRARLLATVAKRVGLATDQQVRELSAYADLLLGQTRRIVRDEDAR